MASIDSTHDPHPWTRQPATTHDRAVSSFDVGEFIEDCLAAPDQAAVVDIVQRAVREPAALERTLTRRLGDQLGILHYSPQLTIQHVVFPPGFRTGIHDHRVWAVIGTWAGYEDNAYFRADDRGGVAEAGGVRCDTGDVITLTDDTIHEVTAPASGSSAALHVYGGALFDEPRSEWVGAPPTERPVDDAAVLTRYLAELGAADLD